MKIFVDNFVMKFFNLFEKISEEVVAWSNNCSRWVPIPMFKTMLNGLHCMKLAIGEI